MPSSTSVRAGVSDHDRDCLAALTPRPRDIAASRAGLRSLVFFWDVEARPTAGVVFSEEAASVDIAALYLLYEPFRDLASGADRRGTRAVPILLGAFSVVVLNRPSAGSGDVGCITEEALVNR